MSAHSIGELLRAFLLADVTVSGLVGTRIYPIVLPQKAFPNAAPALTYQRISGERLNILHGVASAAEPRYQIDAWADPLSGSYDKALELGQAVRNALEGYNGTWTNGVDSAVVAVRFVTERDQFEEDILGGLSRHSADYFVFHSTNAGAL